MLKKDITYEDLEGNPVTETHYFHLSKADLIELQMGKQGGFEEWLKRVIDAKDGATLVRELKDIILLAYGVRSEDGKRFVKNQQLRDEFADSEAFSELFSEIALDSDKAAEFVNGIVPRGLNEMASGPQNVFNQDEPQPAESAVATPPAAAQPEPVVAAVPEELNVTGAGSPAGVPDVMPPAPESD